MGIHKPKDRSEADFARRRLIFDDFFYLQVSLLLSAHLFVDICARAHCICVKISVVLCGLLVCNLLGMLGFNYVNLINNGYCHAHILSS